MSIPDATPDRSRPPLPGPPRDVAFPDYFEHVLGNGIKLVVYERHLLPTVSLNVIARSGAADDGSAPGLASFGAEMLTKGTATRGAMDLAEEIESLGGTLGSSASWDHCTVGVGALSAGGDEALRLLADVARNPAFAEEEIARLREQRLAGLLQRRAHPGAMAYDAFCGACYPGHPYAHPVEGTEQAIRGLDTGALRDFHARTFSADNLLIVAVGDLRPDELLRNVEALFGDLRPAVRAAGDAPSAVQPVPPVVCVADKPGAVQSSILVGHAGIERQDPDFIPVQILNLVLGGYFGSRLNLLLREEKGYTYGAHSRFEARRQAGPFTAGADVRTEVTADAVADTIREITRLAEEEIGAEELARVQRYVTGSFPLQIETPAQVAHRIVQIELFGLGKDYYNTYNSRVMAVTPADLLSAARRHLHPERLVIGVSGDASVLQTQLAPFGSVRVCDSAADPLSASSSNGQTL